MKSFLISSTLDSNQVRRHASQKYIHSAEYSQHNLYRVVLQKCLENDKNGIKSSLNPPVEAESFAVTR